MGPKEKTSVAGTLVLALLMLAHASAQAPVTFEVASVKANKSGDNQVTVSGQGGVTMISPSSASNRT